ncbi:glycosyltransferase family 2 protein [Psychromonas sp. SA13A]|uniref:glycosyltransferase family 2 protein n=1 Tax=Psychromonas sp. SA13A TaxID=2686346 RepID=UPI00140A61DB|nr:glycosyltransferase family 2 protein [Psychromonas sp. SA13A]
MLIKFLPPRLKDYLKTLPYVLKSYLFLYRFLSPYFNHPYKRWIKNIEPTLWQPVLSEQSHCFSIVVPVYNPPIKFLKACVESVQQQSYQNWQLVLVNDASTFPVVNNYLDQLGLISDKITIVTNFSNLHISASTNVGIKASSGDFIVLLDHDDRLAPQALNEVACLLLEQPELEWIYSDEDFINKNGKRVAPHFKSAWNPYLLHAHNYITHLSIYKRDFLQQLGGCRVGFEGAQDYDLALRASEILKPNQIAHIAKILYHWRIHEGSTAANTGDKPYTVKAGQHALIEHFERSEIDAKINEGNLDNFYHVQYIPKNWPKVSIIIPTRDHKSVLETCVSSLLAKTDYAELEIIIMDNQSKQADALAYLAQLNRHENISVIKHDKAFNYSEINNRAVELASGEVIVLLNNDTEVINSAWLKELVGLAMQANVGCVGAKLLYPDQTIQHAGIVMGLGGYAAHSHRCIPNDSGGYYNRLHLNQVVSGVTGACLAIRKETYLVVGGLDESYQVAYNDVDFCLKVKSIGFYNVYCAHAQLYHYESKTRGNDAENPERIKRFDKEKALLLERWKPEIENDPYYSPHLTRDAEDFSIRSRY